MRNGNDERISWSKIARCTLFAALILCAAGFGHAAPCTGQGTELQVLGSGGPETQGRRASSSYLVLRDSKARVLVDSGGGSALRFGEAGAQFSDLDVVVFTHLHADHSADFPALVKSAFFEDRARALPLFGPPGNSLMPSTREFVLALFGSKRGAFRYLSKYVDSKEKSEYKIEARDVSLKGGEVREIFSSEALKILATKVEHGALPVLAFRVEAEGKSVVFSGDTNGEGNLAKLAQRADLFVAHNAVPEGATGVERKLHMPPSVIGRIAAEAKVKHLVLSHRMLRTLGREAQTQQVISDHYAGPTTFADDLDCFAL